MSLAEDILILGGALCLHCPTPSVSSLEDLHSTSQFLFIYFLLTCAIIHYDDVTNHPKDDGYAQDSRIHCRSKEESNAGNATTFLCWVRISPAARTIRRADEVR